MVTNFNNGYYGYYGHYGYYMVTIWLLYIIYGYYNGYYGYDGYYSYYGYYGYYGYMVTMVTLSYMLATVGSRCELERSSITFLYTFSMSFRLPFITTTHHWVIGFWEADISTISASY